MFTFTMSSLRTSGRVTACHQVQNISNSVDYCHLRHGIKHLYNQNNHTPVQAPKSSRALSSDVRFIIILVFGANLMNLAHERSERTAAVDSFQAAGECLALFGAPLHLRRLAAQTSLRNPSQLFVTTPSCLKNFPT